MQILDCHQHLPPEKSDPRKQLAVMKEAGISGGAVFSAPPIDSVIPQGLPFQERLDRVLEWCSVSEQLYPVLFMHPDEPDACQKAKEAAEKGIMGFKMICDNYFVYEEKSMKLLETFAQLNKPVFFHSGILWNGGDSSKYNRPVCWESLINIPNLRFSLAHCSWPWYDECLAVYGKFLNSYTSNPNSSAEMFLDLTPGTPEIYRKDLLYKIFHIGYDVPHNILFGTDCNANQYNADWARHWIALDNQLYEEMGVKESIRQSIYRDNLLRFLGISTEKVSHLSPTSDSVNKWHLD